MFSHSISRKELENAPSCSGVPTNRLREYIRYFCADPDAVLSYVQQTPSDKPVWHVVLNTTTLSPRLWSAWGFKSNPHCVAVSGTGETDDDAKQAAALSMLHPLESALPTVLEIAELRANLCTIRQQLDNALAVLDRLERK